MQLRTSLLEAAVVLAFAAGPRAGAAPVALPPKPSRYATDQAGVFPAARLSALNEKLAAFERETSDQVLVYVDRRLPADTTIEEVANEAVRSWGVGQKGRSNGALFFVFVDDRAMRLEVGYGLEGAIPDARAKQITSDVVKPFFKKGDYAGGIEAGVDAILRAAKGEGYAGTGKTVAEGGGDRTTRGLVPGYAAPFMPLGLAVLALVGRLRKRRGFSAATVLGTVGAIFLAVCAGAVLAAILCAEPLWLILAVPAGIGGLILSIVGAALSGAGSGWTRTSSGGSSWSSSSSSSDWSSSSSDSSYSSSSSDSSFSGGGGDSGGGGSSDSW
jgi:uncharacterized protein